MKLNKSNLIIFVLGFTLFLGIKFFSEKALEAQTITVSHGEGYFAPFVASMTTAAGTFSFPTFLAVDGSLTRGRLAYFDNRAIASCDLLFTPYSQDQFWDHSEWGKAVPYMPTGMDIRLAQDGRACEVRGIPVAGWSSRTALFFRVLIRPFVGEPAAQDIIVYAKPALGISIASETALVRNIPVTAWTANVTGLIRNQVVELAQQITSRVSTLSTSTGAAPPDEEIVSCQVAPPLPTGLSVMVDSSVVGKSCKLQGTPTGVTSLGIYTISAQTNRGRSTQSKFTLRVLSASTSTSGAVSPGFGIADQLTWAYLYPTVKLQPNETISNCTASPLLPGMRMNRYYTRLSCWYYGYLDETVAPGTYQTDITITTNQGRTIIGPFVLEVRAPWKVIYPSVSAYTGEYISVMPVISGLPGERVGACLVGAEDGIADGLHINKETCELFGRSDVPVQWGSEVFTYSEFGQRSGKAYPSVNIVDPSGQCGP